MSMYKRYFFVKYEKFFHKYDIFKFWEKVRIVIKKKRELIYLLKNSKTWKKINTRKGFDNICKWLYWLIEFIKIEYYCFKVFFEKYYFNKDTETYSNEESDEKYYDEKRIDLFLEAIIKIW